MVHAFLLLCRHQGAVCQGRGAGRISRGTAARPERHPGVPVNQAVKSPPKTLPSQGLLARVACQVLTYGSQQLVTAEPRVARAVL